MADIEAKLENWVRRHALTDLEGVPCSHFTLHHMGGNGKIGSEVVTVTSKGDDAGIMDAVTELLDSASSDATGLGMIQTYVVFAYYGEAKKSKGRFPFKASPNDEAEPNEGTQLTEPPTTTGMVTQLMRHNENIMRVSAASMSSVLTAMQTMIAKQATTIEQLTGDRLETLDVMESLMSLKHDRDMESSRETAKIERNKQLVDKLGPLVAIVANKVVGRPLLPSRAPQDLALGELFKTLKPEQLEKLAGVLTQDQLMLILSLAGPYVQAIGPGPETAKTEP
jgi:hypothetical protein